jgi:hypothetical protein
VYETANHAERDRRLDSWKEIAEYVGRDVRTAIRWERERGLPVHRVPGGRRGAVFAYRHEVDGWLRGPGAAPGRNGDGKPAGESAPPVVPAGPTGFAWRRPALLAVFAVALLGTAAWALRVGLGLPGLSVGSHAVDEVRFAGREIVARAAGTELWRHDFGRAVVRISRNGPGRPFAVADLDGDGHRELLVSVTFARESAAAEDELFCFSSEGQVLWSYVDRAPLVFRGGTYGPPFWYGNVVAYRADGEWRVAWSQLHNVWWPARVSLLDARGRPLGAFVHSGSIYDLAVAEGPGGPLLLAGGISNARRAAMLAVLDGRRIAGRSPEPAGSPYECLACEAGEPLRYFLFPPSDITAAVDYPYNATAEIRVVGERIEAHTYEALPDPGARLIFGFSRDLRLVSAAASDSWALHDRLQREGRLDHAAKDCPFYRNPPAVRSWDPSGRWVDLRPGNGTPAPRLASR